MLRAGDVATDAELLREVARLEDVRSGAIRSCNTLATRRIRHQVDALELELRRRALARERRSSASR